MQRRALPHLGPSVAYLAAHGLNLGGTDWSLFRHLRSLDLSQSGACAYVLGCVCGMHFAARAVLSAVCLICMWKPCCTYISD